MFDERRQGTSARDCADDDRLNMKKEDAQKTTIGIREWYNIKFDLNLANRNLVWYPKPPPNVQLPIRISNTKSTCTDTDGQWSMDGKVCGANPPKIAPRGATNETGPNPIKSSVTSKASLRVVSRPITWPGDLASKQRKKLMSWHAIWNLSIQNLDGVDAPEMKIIHYN